MRKYDHLVPIVLRLSLAAVFAWFGTQQLLDPGNWTAYVPAFTANSLVSPESLILLNGWLEMCGAALLITGFRTRPVALVLCLHTLLIAIDTGGAIGVRDLGLAMACLALALATVDKWTLDAQLLH